MRLVIPLALFANPALAICSANEETFVSCQIAQSGKELSVCFTDEVATYRFGAAGKVPELTIITSISDLDYTPWGGVGRAISEIVRFSNAGYNYEVYGGFDRMFGDETEDDIAPAHFGGVSVSREDTGVIDLECRRESVDFAWGEGLYDAKIRAGYIWDHDSSKWVAKP